MGGSAARRQTPRHARPGAGGRRRRAGVLGRAPRSVPGNEGAALLVSQDIECSCRAAEVGASGAKKALAEIWNAEDKRHALDAVTAFEAAYGAKFPKAVAKITNDIEQLLTFYDYPAEHWVHLRTTNPIESTFSTVRNRPSSRQDPAGPESPWHSS